MIRKKFINVMGVSLVIFVLFLQVQFAELEAEVHININGSSIIMQGDEQGQEVSALIVDGRTMAPVRDIFDSFKLELSWDASSNSISTKTNDGKAIWMQIGNKTAKFDGRDYKMDVSPQIIDSKTYLPIKYLFDFLNVTYEWDEENKIVLVDAPSLIEVEVPKSLEDIYEQAEFISDGFYVIRNKLNPEKLALINVSDLSYEEEFKASASKMGIMLSDFSEVNNKTFSYKYFNIEGNYAGVILEKDNQVLSIEFENFYFEDIKYFIDNY